MTALNTKFSRSVSSLVLLLLILSTLPIFFDELRVILANAVSRDLYEVLNSNLSTPDANTISPYAYRVIPFSLIEFVDGFKMPSSFTFLDAYPLPQAIYNKRLSVAIVSYFFQILYSILVYLTLRTNKGLSPVEAGFGFYFAYATVHFTAIYGIDSVTIFVLFVIYCVIQRGYSYLFLFLAVVSIFINEKILLLTAIYICFLFGPRATLKKSYTYIIIISCIGYLGFRKLYPLPGHEYQMTLTTYLPSLYENFTQIWPTLRGVLTVIFPFGFTLILFGIACKLYKLPLRLLAMPVVLLMLGAALNLSFSNGRFVAHAIPLIIVPVIVGLCGLINRKELHEV